ncbi:MAG: hypothetical protein Q9184_005790, partial [Pyrenodesmia sp. 2 TL-2023]
MVDNRGATKSLECAGLVTSVGTDVFHFKAGDRVEYHATSSPPLVFATAICGLRDRANLQSGKLVLIHSGTGWFSMAAIQIVHPKGATFYSTLSTEKNKDFLVENLGVKHDNIFELQGLFLLSRHHGCHAWKSVDFFPITSSIAISVGTAIPNTVTQPPNSFTDNFSHQPHQLGLPALSLGLGAISE